LRHFVEALGGRFFKVTDDRRKHAFISYVRENKTAVDRLCDELIKHGVHVWLDRKEIKPGFDWQDAIREAIQSGDFFIACFSKEYHSRDKSFMNAEITFAIDVLREFAHNRAWFIPVLLSECDVPARSIGGGKTLLNINWVPLYEDWDTGIQRIVEVIRPVPLEIQNLIKASRSLDSDVRKQVTRALGEIGDPAAVPALIAALNDEDGEVRWGAAEALGEIGDPAAVPALIAALRDEERKVRWGAAEALGEIGDPVAVPALTAALSDENQEVRWGAAEALGKIGDPAAVPALIAALNDKVSRVRQEAQWALAHIGPAAVPALRAALRDEDQDVRREAKEALSFISWLRKH
jgi:hypothetical protein